MSVRAGVVDVLFTGDFGQLNAGLVGMDKSFAATEARFQNFMAGGGQPKVVPALEEVGRASTTAEKGVSRVSFALGNMMASGGLTSGGLRGLEMGLLRLMPGLSFGLVGAMALGEGLNLLGDAAEKSEKKAEDAAQNYDDYLKHMQITGPGETQERRLIEAKNTLAGANLRVRDAQAALTIAERAHATEQEHGVAVSTNAGAAAAELKIRTEALTQAQMEQSHASEALHTSEAALQAQYDAEKDSLDALIIKVTQGEMAAYRHTLAIKGSSQAQIDVLVAEKRRAEYLTVTSPRDTYRLGLIREQMESQKKESEQWASDVAAIHEKNNEIMIHGQEDATAEWKRKLDARYAYQLQIMDETQGAQDAESHAWFQRVEAEQQQEKDRLRGVGEEAGGALIEGFILGTGGLEQTLKRTFARLVSSEVMGMLFPKNPVTAAEGVAQTGGGANDWGSYLARGWGARLGTISTMLSGIPGHASGAMGSVNLPGAGVSSPTVVHQHAWNVRAWDGSSVVDMLQQYRGLFASLHIQSLAESDALRAAVKAVLP